MDASKFSRIESLAETLFRNQDDVILALEALGNQDELVKKMKANNGIITSIIEKCRPVNILELPTEMIVMILTNLDLNDLASSKLVCRRFNDAASSVRVSSIRTVSAQQPPNVLEKHLDPRSERLDLTFDKNEEIQFPKSLKEVIERGESMPNLKSINIYNGRFEKAIKGLPKNVPHLTFRSVKQAMTHPFAPFSIRHLNVLEVHFRGRNKGVGHERYCWLGSFLMPGSMGIPLALNSLDRSGRIKELVSEQQFAAWADSALQQHRFQAWSSAWLKLNEILRESLYKSEMLGARLSRSPSGLAVTMFVP